MEELLLLVVRFLFSGVWVKAASFLMQEICAVESVGSLGKRLCSWAGGKKLGDTVIQDRPCLPQHVQHRASQPGK